MTDQVSYDSGMYSVIPAPPTALLLELEAFAKKRVFDDPVMAAALMPLVPIAYAEAVRRGEAFLACDMLREAADIVWDMKYALMPLSTNDPYHGRLWCHSNHFPVDPLKEEAWCPDQAALEAATARYLDRPWMSAGHLDWALVDALTRREILGYEWQLASAMPRPWTSAWATQKALTVWLPWLIESVIAAASAWWLWVEFSSSASEAPHRWWWAAGFGAYYAWSAVAFLISVPVRIRRRRARRKELVATMNRLVAMRSCYAELNGPVLDPTRIRDALLVAEKLEVRWSRATWPLLEAAIARHPHRWMTG